MTNTLPASIPTNGPPGLHRRIRVVCVDDCPRVLAAWARLLGIQPDMESVAILESGSMLPDIFEAGRPDVVVMDLSLSEGNSLPTLQALITQQPEARVLVYSGHSGQQVVDRCIAAGAWGFIGKDAEPSIVLDSIRRIARGEAVFPTPPSTT